MRTGYFFLFVVLLVIPYQVNMSAQTEYKIQKNQQVEKIENTGCGYSEENFSVLTNYLKNTDGTKGYIIVCEGKISAKNYKDGILIGLDYLLPARDSAQKARQKIKERLLAAGIKSNRIVFIKGGGRDYFSVDFWMVPNKAKAPKAAPTVEKIIYRKGRSEGFCS